MRLSEALEIGAFDRIRPYSQGTIQGTIIERETDARPIIINVPPQRLSELMKISDRVIVRKTVTFDEIVIEVLRVEEPPTLPASFEELKELYIKLREEYENLATSTTSSKLEEAKRRLRELEERLEQARKAWEQSLRCSVCGSPAVRVYEGVDVGLYKHSDESDFIVRFACPEYERALAISLATYLPERNRAEARKIIEEHFGMAIIGDERLERELEELEKEYERLSAEKRQLEQELEEKYEERRATLRKKIRMVAREILKLCEEDSSLLDKISDEEYRKLLVDSI
jgi:uncharacterized protein YlxW (UPF0749 family)